MSHFKQLTICLLAVLFLAALPARADGPPRWILSDDDTKITLIGTVHALPPRLDWMRPDIKKAIKEANTVYFELSPAQSAPAVMVPLIRSKAFWQVEGERLSNHLPEHTIKELERVFATMGMTRASMETMEPWFLGMNVSVIQMIRLGWDPALGAERVLQSLAEKAGVPVEGLESAELQLAVFDTLPLAQQADFVTLSLGSFDTLEADSSALLNAWLDGDADKIGVLMTKGLSKSPYLIDRLLTDRNAAWVKAIKAMLEYPGNIVIAVGAGHLAGDNSVIAMLEKQGYKPARTGQ